MSIYIIFSITLLYLAIRYDNKDTSNSSETWKSIVFWGLVLLAGLRNHVGADTFNYEYHFYNTPKLGELFSVQFSMQEITQPLWLILLSVLRTIWDNFVALTLFHAIVFNYLLFRFLKQTTPYFFTSLFFVFCMQWWYFNFELMRESLCVVMILNGCLYLKSNNLIKFLLFSAPTIFIHYFAFVPVALILLFNHLKIKYVFGICIITVLLFYSISVESFQTMALNFALSYASDSNDTFEQYLYGDYAITNLNILGYLEQIFKILPAFLVVLYLYKQSLLMECKLTLLYFICFLLSMKVPMLDRFCDYFFIVFVVYITQLLYDKNAQFRKVAVLFFAYTFLSFTLSFYRPTSIDHYNSNVNIRYIPYKNIFQEKDQLRESNFQRIN